MRTAINAILFLAGLIAVGIALYQVNSPWLTLAVGVLVTLVALSNLTQRQDPPS
jgi:hypothetical protein